MARPLYETVMEALDVGGGSRLLDAGCGTGLALRMAADRGAEVTGIDILEEALEVAGRRAPGARLMVADLERLPFPDSSFDLVTGFNSFQFARDPVSALREAGRVTNAGGQVAVAVWSEPGRSDAARFLQAVGTLLPDGGGAANPFLLSSPGTLERLIEVAGLRPLAGSEVECPWVYPDAESAWLALSRSARGTVVRAVEEVGEARTRAVVLEALQPYRRPDGSYRLINRFTTVIARR